MIAKIQQIKSLKYINAFFFFFFDKELLALKVFFIKFQRIYKVLF